MQTTTGNILTMFRQLSGPDMTKAKLSEILKVSAPFISRVESDEKKFSEESLERLFEFYKIPVKEFYKINAKASCKDWSYQKTYYEVCKVWLKYHPC